MIQGGRRIDCVSASTIHGTGKSWPDAIDCAKCEYSSKNCFLGTAADLLRQLI